MILNPIIMGSPNQPSDPFMGTSAPGLNPAVRAAVETPNRAETLS
jgi:hypothetical protein